MGELSDAGRDASGDPPNYIQESLLPLKETLPKESVPL
jgi:hypothetical protein